MRPIQSLLRLATAVLLTACASASPPGTSTLPTPTAEPTLRGCVPDCLPGARRFPACIPAGDYQTANFFGGRMRVTLEQAMTSVEDSTGEFHLTPDNPDAFSRDILFWVDVYPWAESRSPPSEVPSAADLVTQLAANPNLLVSEPIEGTIGKLPATIIDLSASDTAENQDAKCPVPVCVNTVDFPQWDNPYAIADPMSTRWFLADVTYGGSDPPFRGGACRPRSREPHGAAAYRRRGAEDRAGSCRPGLIVRLSPGRQPGRAERANQIEGSSAPRRHAQ